jgi:hypothetical protein
MIRSALGKVMWVGRATVFLVGVAVTLALLLGVATTALAALPGDPFRLGQTNGIDAMSTLVGNVASPMLRVDNSSTAAGATALDLQVEAGKPPMRVNSATKVARLNSDRLDGKSEENFYAAGSKVADSDKLDGKNSTDFWSGVTYTQTEIFYGRTGEFTHASMICRGSDGDVLLSGGYGFATNAGYTVTTDMVGNGIYYLTWYTPSNFNGQQATVSIHCADLGTPK